MYLFCVRVLFAFLDKCASYSFCKFQSEIGFVAFSRGTLVTFSSYCVFVCIFFSGGDMAKIDDEGDDADDGESN